MIFLHHDIKHLCEFWNFAKKDKQKNSEWRLYITKNQKEIWPITKKLRQKQLASDQENNIYLLEEEGFQDEPVFEGNWNAVKKYLEPTNWPSAIEISRCSAFFHLNILQSLILCVKASFERKLKEEPNVYDFVRIGEETIDKLTKNLLENIDGLKFKIDIRTFRNIEELYSFFLEYFQIDIDFENFKKLITEIIEKKIHLHSIFDNDVMDFINTTDYGVVKEIGEDKEKAVLVVLKVKYSDRKIEMREKINELNRLAEEYGIIIEEWRDSIGVSYNYYKKTCELVENLKKSNTEITPKSINKQFEKLFESNISNQDDYSTRIETNLSRVYEESAFKNSHLELKNIRPGKSFIDFAADKKEKNLSLLDMNNDSIEGTTPLEKIKFLENEIEKLDKTNILIDDEIKKIEKNPDNIMIRQHMHNKKFYKEQFLNEALKNLETITHNSLHSESKNSTDLNPMDSLNILKTKILEQINK